jgi:hypothetical protein
MTLPPRSFRDKEFLLHLRERLRQYKLSDLYDEPAVTAAVEKIAAEEHAKAAA